MDARVCQIIVCKTNHLDRNRRRQARECISVSVSKQIGQRARGLRNIVLALEERTGAKSHLGVSEKLERGGFLIGSEGTNKAKQPATWNGDIQEYRANAI